jgi:hypothetical protein
VNASTRQFWDAVHRRAALLAPDARAAYLRAWRLVADSLTDAAVARLMARGGPDAVVAELLSDAVFDRAFAPLRAVLQDMIRQGVDFHAKRLPASVQRGAKIGTQTVGVRFNVLAPSVRDAAARIDLKHVVGARDDARALLRTALQDGIEEGVNPRVIARRVRPAIGLGPTQWQEVANFRRALEEGDVAKALGYARRDRRFDAAIKKGSLTPERIDRMVEAYTKRRVAWNAETNARTATLDAMKFGQRAAWEESIALGVVERSQLRQRWATVLDGRERPAHRALNGTVVGFDQAFPNGERTPGESTYNCRCLAVVFVAPKP